MLDIHHLLQPDYVRYSLHLLQPDFYLMYSHIVEVEWQMLCCPEIWVFQFYSGKQTAFNWFEDRYIKQIMSHHVFFWPFPIYPWCQPLLYKIQSALINLNYYISWNSISIAKNDGWFKYLSLIYLSFFFHFCIFYLVKLQMRPFSA